MFDCNWNSTVHWGHCMKVLRPGVAPEPAPDSLGRCCDKEFPKPRPLKEVGPLLLLLVVLAVVVFLAAGCCFPIFQASKDASSVLIAAATKLDPPL